MTLRQAARGRGPNAPLFDRIKRLDIRFRTIAKRVGAVPEATPYALRHSSIVRMLLNAVPTRVVASHHDTSVLMVEKHYSRFISDVSDSLTRRTLLDFAAPPRDNVVALAR